MSEMSLVLSETFTAEDAASIRAELGRRLQVGKPVSLRQRSIDPPSVIQLLGEAAAWLPLVVAATAFAKSFFGTLGKKSGRRSMGERGSVEGEQGPRTAGRCCDGAHCGC